MATGVRSVPPVERNAGGQRRGEKIRKRDNELVRIAARTFDVEKAFTAGPTGLVDHRQRLLHQIVFGDYALDDPCHLVGTAASACRYNDLRRPGRLPGSLRCRYTGRRQHCRGKCYRVPTPLFHRTSSVNVQASIRGA
jgi:hypothetical protein